MTGFTAINADGIVKDPRQYNARQTNKLVAADYLGCDEGDSRVPPIPHVTHGAGAKTASNKGRKRTSMSASTSQEKRCKSGIIADGLTVTKPATGETKPCKQDNTYQPPKPIPEVMRKPNTVVKSLPNGGNNPTSISVYAATTSMDSVSLTEQTTSIDTVRSSQSYGHTLYSGSNVPSSVKREVQFSQPWLNIAGNGSIPMHSPKAREARCPDAAQYDSPGFASEDQHARDGSHSGAKVHLQKGSKVVRTTATSAQFPTRISSSVPSHGSGVRTQPKRQAKKTPTIQTDKDYRVSDDSDDAAMADLAYSINDMATRAVPPPHTRVPKRNVRAVAADYDYDGGLFSDTERHLLTELKSQALHNIGRPPVVRQPFPAPILDRSPIFGATSHTLLRTCFRIGEALNVGCRAVRTNEPFVLLLELYARVTRSWREGRAQHFVFCDLYHDRPPHLVGTYELWDQSRLWERDSRAFLGAGDGAKSVMCRAMARMRRDGTGWQLEVMGIWEADWDDVDFVAGIYQKEDGKNWGRRKVEQ